MTINIVDVVEYKYPGQILKGNITFRQEWQDSPIEIIKWDVPNVARPLEADLLAEAPQLEHLHQIKQLKDAAQRTLIQVVDSKAQEKGYKDSISITTYVTSSNDTWSAEARAFIDWRDSVYEYSIDILQQVEQGMIPVPELEEFIGGLPVMVWSS
jgi:hypothetical protein